MPSLKIESNRAWRSLSCWSRLLKRRKGSIARGRSAAGSGTTKSTSAWVKESSNALLSLIGRCRALLVSEPMVLMAPSHEFQGVLHLAECQNYVLRFNGVTRRDERLDLVEVRVVL